MYLLLSFTQVFAKHLQLLFCLYNYCYIVEATVNYNYYYVSKLDKKKKQICKFESVFSKYSQKVIIFNLKHTMYVFKKKFFKHIYITSFSASLWMALNLPTTLCKKKSLTVLIYIFTLFSR